MRRSTVRFFACCSKHLLSNPATDTSSTTTTLAPDPCFDIKPNHVRVGKGAAKEIGRECRRLGMSRVMIFTDPHVHELPVLRGTVACVRAAGLTPIVYKDVCVEPTYASFQRAGTALRESGADGVVSVGGGSVMDTAKAAALWSRCDAQTDCLLDYFNRPVGVAKPPPPHLPPHVAVPTTCGTGSECTPIAICDVVHLHRKTGIVHKSLTPVMAIVDPTLCYSLPSSVVAASGFDVLSHAIESYTARCHQTRLQEFPNDGRSPVPRPSLMGRNMYTDMGCLEALARVGRSYVAAVANPEKHQDAIDDMVFASTLAGTAIGSAGCHMPHAMSYPVSGNIPRTFCPEFPYPGGPGSTSNFLIDEGVPPVLPHGLSVALHTPAVMRFLQTLEDDELNRRLQRVLHVLLNGDTCFSAAAGHAAVEREQRDAGSHLSDVLVRFIQSNRMPMGLAAVGFHPERDVPKLAQLCMKEARLLANAPFEVTETHLSTVYAMAMAYS